jgi:hypothetical protein
MKKILGILCWIRGWHYMIFDSGTRTAAGQIIRSRCATCGHPEEEIIAIGMT